MHEFPISYSHTERYLIFSLCERNALYFTPPRCQVEEGGEGRIKPPQSLNIGVFNVHGCSTNKVKKSEIGKMFLRPRFDVCALSETKLKEKGEVMFGEVVGGRQGEGRGDLLLSGWLMRCVIEWKEVSSRLMWVRVNINIERVGCL